MNATCQKCQAQLVPQAEFCANCGTRPGQNSSGWTAAIIVGVLVLVALTAAIGLTSKGLLRTFSGKAPAALPAAGSAGTDGLAASGEAGSNALSAAGEATSNSVGLTAELPPPATQVIAGQMPRDISDWLDHLLRTHNRLRGLNRTLTSQHSGDGASLAPGTFPEDQSASASADDSRRRSRASGILASVNQFFVTLERDFRAVPPPPECVPLAQLYGAALQDIPVMIGELYDAVQELDIAKAESVGHKHHPLVEGRISETNRLIDELCERYDVTNRWRLVEDTDYGMSSLFGAGGLGMSGEALKQYGDLLKDLVDEDR